MKTIILLLISINLFSQTDSVTIFKHIDKMTDKVYYMADRDFVMANKNKTKGAIFIYSEGTNSLIVEFVGLGNCNENNEMIILFKNGMKTTLYSWNKFNCDNAYFKIEDAEYLLRNQPIEAIRVMNGYSNESLTVDIPKRNQRYFIQLYKSLDKIVAE